MQIYYSQFKGTDSVTVENDALKVTFLPTIGGKMASLIDKKTKREYLWQEPGEKLDRPEYDTLFEKWGMFGFDEMFPTISECYYEEKPWQGIRLPDHGEVWSLPWEYDIHADHLHMWVYGVRFPYRLDKWVRFADPLIIRIDYNAANLSSFDFKFIWAAHPLFNVEPGTRIILPKSVESIMNTNGGRERLGDFGQIHPWPRTKTTTGEEYEIDRVYPDIGTHYEKYYVLDELNEGWAALQNPQTKDVLALSFPPDKVPYLGLWVNEGGYYNQYNVALEPCTGAFDRVDMASRFDKVSVVPAKGSYTWHLGLTIGRQEVLRGVGSDGKLY